MTIEHKFEEVSLCLDNDKSGKRQCIALITGTAHISTNIGGAEGWEIESVVLEPPCVGQVEAEISYGHPLFNFVSDSIAYDCGDKIWDEALEARRPDPDREYDRRRDEQVA